MFYANDCPACEEMKYAILRIEHRCGVEFIKHNIDEDESAYRAFENYATVSCDGVPLLYDTASQSVICGTMSYAEISQWIRSL